MPRILTSAALCSKNQGTIDNLLVSFQENLLTRNLVIPRSIVNCWLLMQQSAIFVIFVKVAISNFGPNKNHL
jgi:hypothetical protein